jgi:hypothetical protein
MFFIGRTDGRTDRRSTQNYSSEPHKIIQLTIKVKVHAVSESLKFELGRTLSSIHEALNSHSLKINRK